MALSTDSFDRANNGAVLGTTDGAGTLDPLTWVQQIGTLGISSNQGFPSAYGAGNLAIATVDLAVADVDLSITFSVITNPGLCFRLSTSGNFWIWRTTAAGTSRLYKIVAGAFTQVGTDQTGAANGDVMRVVANGSSISCYRNGVLKISATDSFNSTQTKHGFYFDGTLFTGRVDNWTASALTVTTTVTGTQASETDSGASGSISDITLISGGQGLENDSGGGGTATLIPFTTFRPPTELTVSNVAYEVPPIWNRLMRFYPLRKRGRAVWKLPDIDDTTADAYTFDQPYPWITPDDLIKGQGFPATTTPISGLGTSDSNLKAPATIDKVFYGGHVYTITVNESTGLAAFLTDQGYVSSDWITVS